MIRPMNRSRLATLLLALAICLLTACGAGAAGGKKHVDEMTGYGTFVRWNDFDKAWGFVDPVVRAERPLTDLERSRFRQIQVTGYELRNQTMSPDGLSLEQVVEIRVVNVHTQVERIVTDHQRWTYDPDTKHWWLVSGLPDFNAEN
jgi:hypothetical protein